ncbi:esterase-like activity of phytase family protein [Allobranchiibius sp. GilTou38]|uniref:esterase-like activity of phytase family protein n=1 Tax=Allobranchiibius sp. GilTou38 TaxID=2815210 RepID=UPI001AA14D4F|nr:esterase-like activity of phytase family protein [Allobranchiibius sp. GilTou38]MBO1768538.1 esterase-like activity of phytase family protein [Allobranchiibius sp. GilTou38]
MNARRITHAATICTATLAAVFVTGPLTSTAQAASAERHGHGHRPVYDCPPRARAVGYSDALDKLNILGAEVGGLSALTYDARRHAYAAIEDHSGDQASRMWFFRDAAHPQVTGTLTLTQADGTPYTGADFDAEGLAVLPNGDYLVSSEVEPSIRVFDRSGREVGQLPVPARLHVPPTGEATPNATLEGLSISPDGATIYAAMEGTLSGDVSSTGDAGYRRILVYTKGRYGYALTRQLGYHVDPGMRISEVAAYGRDGLLVMEAAYEPATGNAIELYAVHTRHARDVSAIGDLGNSPHAVLRKTLVSNVTACPSLGATAKEPQSNPLMDNYEGMTIETRHGRDAQVLLISDDNFSATQTTRLLRLQAALPRH